MFNVVHVHKWIYSLSLHVTAAYSPFSLALLLLFFSPLLVDSPFLIVKIWLCVLYKRVTVPPPHLPSQDNTFESVVYVSIFSLLFHQLKIRIRIRKRFLDFSAHLLRRFDRNQSTECVWARTSTASALNCTLKADVRRRDTNEEAMATRDLFLFLSVSGNGNGSHSEERKND